MSIPAIVVRLLQYACWFFLVLTLFGGVFRLAELVSSSSDIRKYVRSLRSVDYRRFQDSEHIMPVSLILPATEETESLADCVRNLLSLEFRRYEVIVVADRSNEKSWASLQEAYSLLPFRQPFKRTLKGEVEGVYRSAMDVRLVVLDQKRATRADALNAGVNVATYPIVAVTYPHLRLTKNALLKAVYAFVGDAACVYIGAFARVGDISDWDETKKPGALADRQTIERLRLLYTHSIAYKDVAMYLPLQTTFAAFRKSAVLETGGFSAEAEAEQADLLLRMHARYQKEKHAYCARLLPDAVCFEQPLESMRSVLSERGRAQGAMHAVLRRNRPLPRKTKGLTYTRLGETGWPLAQIAGIVIVFAAALLGAASYWFFACYVLLGALLGALQSAGSVLLEEYAFRSRTDTGLLLRRYMRAVLENFGYRQRVALARLFVRR